MFENREAEEKEKKERGKEGNERLKQKETQISYGGIKLLRRRCATT